MNNQESIHSYNSLHPSSAKNLSHSTKSLPMMEEISPRWLLNFLPWISVEAGVYKINKRRKLNLDLSKEEYETSTYKSCITNEYGEKIIKLNTHNLGEHDLPHTFPDYEETPQNRTLNIIHTNLRVNTQISDIFNHPINQLEQQMRLTIEAMKEKQEWEIVNNRDCGLLHSAHHSMRIKPKAGSPTPDDMDELLSLVWKKPAFFLAHPKAITAFGRECTRRGVPPASINLYGSPFLTWRGVPIVPCDKLLINDKSNHRGSQGTTNILLMRVGEKEQGVIGLHQPGLPDETSTPSLSSKFAGIDSTGIASYILNLYFSTAVLTDDALGILQDVEVGKYHEYK